LPINDYDITLRIRTLIATSRRLVVEDRPSGTIDVSENAAIATGTAKGQESGRLLLTAGRWYRRAISQPLRLAAAEPPAPFRRLADLFLRCYCIIGGLNRRLAVATERERASFHVAAVVVIAAGIVCLVLLFSYYDESCGDSVCERTNGRTGRSWTSAFWNDFGLQIRHISPPPV